MICRTWSGCAAGWWIDHGRVLVDGDLDTVRRRFGGAGQLVVEPVEPSAALYGLPGVLAVTVEAGGLRQRLAFSRPRQPH